MKARKEETRTVSLSRDALEVVSLGRGFADGMETVVGLLRECTEKAHMPKSIQAFAQGFVDGFENHKEAVLREYIVTSRQYEKEENPSVKISY